MLGKNGRLFGSNFGFDDDERRRAHEYAIVNDVIFGHDEASRDYDDEDELEDELELSGLDVDELEMMGADERREALEDAGLDPDDFE